MKDAVLEKRLGDVVDVQSGFAFKSSEYSDSGHFLIRIANVQDGYLSLEKPKYVALNAKTKRFELRAGDILTSLTGNVGRVAKVEPEHLPAALNQRVARLVPKPDAGIDAQYLLRFLHSSAFSGFLEERAHGAAQANVSPSVIGEIPIPLPPLEEQQRIVGVLDEAFEGLACARKNAEVNLQNARELFESKRRDLLTTGSDSWATKSLNEVCVVERGSSPRPIKNFVTESADGVHWVKIGDTRVGSKYVTGTKQKITKKGAEKSRAVFAGDFILTNSMTYGRPYIMGIDGYIHDGWFVLRLKDEIDTDFFFHLLSSKVVQDQFEQLAAGSVVKNISGDLVKKAVLSLPPIGVQTIIASELDSISNDIERIEKAYTAKLQDLDDLRQSLLQQAFAGELT